MPGRPWHRWTKAEERELTRLNQRGLTIKSIAKVLRLTPGQVRNKLRVLELSQRPEGPVIPTSFYLPKEILAALDAEAAKQKTFRSRLLTRILKKRYARNELQETDHRT